MTRPLGPPMLLLLLASVLAASAACSAAGPGFPGGTPFSRDAVDRRELAPALCVASASSGARRGWVTRAASGPAAPSLREALGQAALPAPLVARIATAFAYDSDLPAELPSGSRFRVVYEARTKASLVAEAEIRCAAIDDGKKRHELYRFEMRGGALALVHDDGRGVAWIDLEKPVRGAPVTSPFGWRIHPVFGDLRFHRGIDLGAAAGTPVVAAASGVVVAMGARGNYGRLVVVRHDEHLETSYAHLAHFARGLHIGARVKRGQRIGLVGRSGVATGPHLYFEVAVDRVRIDPLTASAGFPIQLTTSELARLRHPGAPVSF